jgi:polyhydroxybutyrate depolymerase
MKAPYAILPTAILFAGLAGCGGQIPSPAPTQSTDSSPEPSRTAGGAESTESPTLTFTAAPPTPGLSLREITVDDMPRSYYLYAPKDFRSRTPLPVVMVFHGLNQDGSYLASTTGFNDLADTDGFLAVYPNGSGGSEGLSWNAGSCCGFASDHRIDEPAFVRGILADLEQWTAIDSRRIYAAGFSNGGGLAYRLGCEMADTLAAIAPVGGAFIFERCRPSRPISLLDLHGSADQVVPFAGGGSGPNMIPPVEEVLAAWAEFNGCGEGPLSEQGEAAAHTYYAGCADGTAVEAYLIQNIGHSWPANAVWPATKTIWEFFAAHPKA